MSDVNLQLVKEFFELNGFMILTNRKHQLRKIGVDWEYSIELLVANLDFVKPEEESGFLLEPRDLKAIPRAIVDVKGWHTEVFYPSTIESARSFFAFVSPESLQYATRVFKGEPFSKVMVLSELPSNKEILARSIDVLRKNGIDHTLEFSTILRDLISHVQINNNYTESDTLQLVRLMKRYGIVKDLQMEFLFR
ncbi:MAG: hypothetical protein KAJ01_09915 [Candidatus Hydrogenedentes bacterium]|nr:hypothetical protein [Candidatus Hydrogenedentota bacterium]